MGLRSPTHPSQRRGLDCVSQFIYVRFGGRKVESQRACPHCQNVSLFAPGLLTGCMTGASLPELLFGSGVIL